MNTSSGEAIIGSANWSTLLLLLRFSSSAAVQGWPKVSCDVGSHGMGVLLMTAGYKTVMILFNKMLLCIFRALMSFFDATLSGHILSRAFTDQNALDLNISSLVGSFAFAMIQLQAAIGVMSWVAWAECRDSIIDRSGDYKQERGTLQYSVESSLLIERLSMKDQHVALKEGFSSDEEESGSAQACLLFEYLERDQPYGREPLSDKILDLARRFPGLKSI